MIHIAHRKPGYSLCGNASPAVYRTICRGRGVWSKTSFRPGEPHIVREPTCPACLLVLHTEGAENKVKWADCLCYACDKWDPRDNE